MRQIIVPPGIGDSVWLLQFLINQPEKFDFILPGGLPRRGKQIFDLLPQVAATCQYASDRRINYNRIKKFNAHLTNSTWKSITSQGFFLSANEWLEQGKLLRGFFPDLELSYKIDWKIDQWKVEVDRDLGQFGCCIGIYGSSYSTSRAWGFWQEEGWLELIEKIHQVRPDVTFCLIGAEWDLNLNGGLVQGLNQKHIPYYNTVGKPLGYVMQMMRQLDYAFYFPSGLAIVSETLIGGGDCTMFYPPHLALMMGKWCDPQRTKNSNFKEIQFCTPQEMFDWVKNEYKLFDKI